MSVHFTNDDRRATNRLKRRSNHAWRLRLEDDQLITKNIVNVSPTGLAFKAPSSSNIKTGQVLKFVFTWDAGQEFECEGRVLWVGGIEKSGVMRQVGLEFSEVPSSLGSVIKREIQENAAKEKHERVRHDKRPIPLQIVDSAPPTLRSAVVQILGAVLIATLTSAFVMALWMHNQTHSKSMARRDGDQFQRKISGVIEPQK